MNINSFRLTAAVVATISAAATMLSAQSYELIGKVPMDFQVSTTQAPKGRYRISVLRPGMVAIQTEEGKAVGVRVLPVKTQSETAKNSIQFHREMGTYQFSGYCLVSYGCWSTGGSTKEKSAANDKIEIALVSPR